MNTAPLLLPRPATTNTGPAMSSGWQSADDYLSPNSLAGSRPGQQQYFPTLSSQVDSIRPLPVLRSSSFNDQATTADWRTLTSTSSDAARNGYYSTINGKPSFDSFNGGSIPFQHGYSQGYSTINAGSMTRTLPSTNWNHSVGKYTSAAQLVTRRRAVRACRHCRRRKIRCSGANQSKDGRCENCERAGIERCIFSSVGTETQKDPPSQATWQQSTLPPDVQLCSTYGEPHRSSRQTRPPGFPPVLWPGQQNHTLGPQFFAPPPFLQQPPVGHFPVLPHDSSARKRSYDNSLSTMPSASQSFENPSPSPFASNFWAPSNNQDHYLGSPGNQWATDKSNSVSHLTPTRRDSKQQLSFYDGQQTGMEGENSTQKTTKTSSGRMLSSILPSIEATSVPDTS